MTKYLKTKEGSLEDLAKQMQSKVIESDYQDKFKKELDKAGKPIGQMTGAEKKSFFNKIDKMHTAKNEMTKDSAYAIGMAQAMKSTGDKPPLEKSTITKAHDIAKSIEKDKKEEVGQKEIDKFHTSLDKLVHKSFGHSSDEKKKEMKKEEKDVPKGYHKMPDGKIMKDSEHKKEEVKETHSFVTNKQNEKQKEVGGEKSPISHMINKSVKELNQNAGKTFAQMRAEIDEACWDTHKQVGTKMKGGKQVPNCVPKNESTHKDKNKKELQAGDDTRDPKQKTMTGQIATSPEMNPKVDYKY